MSLTQNTPFSHARSNSMQPTAATQRRPVTKVVHLSTTPVHMLCLSFFSLQLCPSLCSLTIKPPPGVHSGQRGGDIDALGTPTGRQATFDPPLSVLLLGVRRVIFLLVWSVRLSARCVADAHSDADQSLESRVRVADHVVVKVDFARLEKQQQGRAAEFEVA